MASKGRAKKKRIVLVEDEPTMANLIERELEQKGYAVKKTRNGKKGLELIREEKPDAVLLDIMLPGLGGFDILEALSADQILPGLPIIIISNSGQPVEIERAKKLGVRDYLIKVNFNPGEVLEKVTQLFESEEARKNQGKQKRAPRREKQILLVEDDATLADALERKLQQKKYVVHRASNAEVARKILGENTIDVILLDLVLPDVSGFTFLGELKGDPTRKDIPILIISNLGQQDEIEQGLRAGALDYIVKANTIPGEIAEKVDRIITKYRS